MFLLSRQLQSARTVYKTSSTACIVLVVFFFNRCEYINFPGFQQHTKMGSGNIAECTLEHRPLAVFGWNTFSTKL